MQTTDNERPPVWTNYAKKTSMLLGVAHIVVGVLCIGFHIAVIVDVTPTAKIGQGIWGGLFVSDLLLYFISNAVPLKRD